MESLMSLYAVQNHKGQYYRTYSSTRNAGWVDDLKKAKVWSKLAQAKSKITTWANENPKEPIPVLVEFVVTEVRVVDQIQRVAKSRQEKAQKEAERQRSLEEYRLKQAERDLREAQARVDAFKNVRR